VSDGTNFASDGTNFAGEVASLPFVDCGKRSARIPTYE